MAENHSETRSSDVHVLRDVSASSAKACRTRSVLGGWVGVVCWCVDKHVHVMYLEQCSPEDFMRESSSLEGDQEISPEKILGIYYDGHVMHFPNI